MVSKPGSGGNMAFAYLAQHAGDPHYLLIGTPGLVIGQLVGYTQFRHTDFTPIASLVNDYTVFAVNAASSFRTGKDLVDRLLKDPKSVALGVGGAVGGLQTLPAGLLMKAAGGNPRDLKVVAFKGSAESVTNLLGGHIDLVTTAAGNAVDHVGKLRVVAVAAPQRFGGALAGVPTWREQGFDVVFGALARDRGTQGSWRRASRLLGSGPAQGDGVPGMEGRPREALLVGLFHAERAVPEGDRAGVRILEGGAGGPWTRQAVARKRSVLPPVTDSLW